MSYWTPEEVIMLRAAYAKQAVDLKPLENSTGRLRSNICRKARALGLKTVYSRPKSERHKESMRVIASAEDQWLKENYNDFTNGELARRFNVHEETIQKAARRLGLRKSYKDRGWVYRAGHPRGFKGRKHGASARTVMGQASRIAWANPLCRLNSPEYRQELSDRAVAWQKGGGARNRYSRCRGGKREDLGGRYFRSSWEANYARYLNWMMHRGEIKCWGYELDTFDFPVKRGTRFYTPDFRVTENDGSIAYHEVKGWMTQQSRTALNRMRIYHPETKIVLIAKDEYRALSKWRGLIPGWER